MSTILDALRKLEEDNRTRNADVRTQLLSVPNRFDLRLPRRQRVPWILGGGLICTGIALGAGLMFWGPASQPSGKEEPTTAEVTTNKIPPPTSQPSSLPRQQTASETPIALSKRAEQETNTANEGVPVQPRVALMTPGAPAVSLPQKPGGLTPSPLFPSNLVPKQFPAVPPPPQTSAPRVSPEVRQELPGDFPVAGENEVVQRSPFVTTPAPERSAAPAPPAGERSVAVLAKPVPTPSPTPTKTARLPQVPTPLPSRPPVQTPEEETGPPPINASLNFLQWSPESDKRIAFIKVEGGPTTLVHEGDTIGGATVVKIRQDAVDLRSGESQWTLRAR